MRPRSPRSPRRGREEESTPTFTVYFARLRVLRDFAVGFFHGIQSVRRMSRGMKWEEGSILLSDDPPRVDFDAIEAALRTTYWADDRPREVIEAAFRNSLPFGLYDRTAGGRQVGFARAI